jgi:hypothetical protein
MPLLGYELKAGMSECGIAEWMTTFRMARSSWW